MTGARLDEPPEGFEPDVFRVLAIYNGLQRGTRRFHEELSSKTGLSEPSLYILELVRMGVDRPSKISEISEFLPSTVTFQTDKLVAAGLITRTALPTDRRVVQLRLTPQGEAIHRQLSKAHNSFLRERLKALEPWELETFLAIGRKIVEPRPGKAALAQDLEESGATPPHQKTKARKVG